MALAVASSDDGSRSLPPGEPDPMTDILLLALIIAAPGALIAGWLALLGATIDPVKAPDAPELDERTLLSPRRDRFGSPAGAFPG
jgi:hypothetical protein